jgi:hypothetical protein
VLGAVTLALTVNIAAAIGWLRRRWGRDEQAT